MLHRGLRGGERVLSEAAAHPWKVSPGQVQQEQAWDGHPIASLTEERCGLLHLLEGPGNLRRFYSTLSLLKFCDCGHPKRPLSPSPPIRPCPTRVSSESSGSSALIHAVPIRASVLSSKAHPW